METLVLKYACTAFCSLSLALVSFSLSYMFGSLMKAIGANPSAVDKVFTLVLITAALVESIALLVFGLAYLVAFVIK